jgi:peroxiredoxin-like protein
MSDAHTFEAQLEWTGAGAAPFDYDHYSRDFRVEIPGRAVLEASSAPAFKGDASRVNPEDLLVAALSTCHALTYLALMARSRIPVLAYRDAASGTMDQHDGIVRFTTATLRPHVVVPKGSDLEKARALHEKANKHCFIAQSVNFPVHHAPTFEER